METKEYRVVFTIDVQAVDPLDAADQVNTLLTDPKKPYAWQFFVQKKDETKLWNIDFAENPVLVEKVKDKPFIIN